MKDLFTIEPSEAANTQPSVTVAAPVDEVATEESQEEPETTAEGAEVSGGKPGGGKVSQNLLEQVSIHNVNLLYIYSGTSI